jgi:L-fuculose-phosphate aldolase
VSIDPEGTVVGGRREPSSERRVHLAVYAARPDAGALVHTHSTHATAWSFLDEPLDTGTEELEQAARGAVLTAPYAPTGSDEIAAAAVGALGDRGAVLLGRHGVLALGAEPGHALDAAMVIERQAQLAWLLRG